MQTKNILLLASKSKSRQMLLRQMAINFMVIEQSADEAACDWNLSLDQVVQNIAHFKMEHALLPAGKVEGEVCFVLTADTLSQDSTGRLQGKPLDKSDAIEKIRASRAGNNLSTAFCLDKKVWKDGFWHLEKRISQVVSASYVFDIPEGWIETYFKNSYGMQCAGAIAIEDFGGQFLKNVTGSYSTIVGLPQFELRQALETLGFFE